MKRFLVLFLSVVLAIGMLSLTTFAEEELAAETGSVLEAEEPAEELAEESVTEEDIAEPEAQPEEVAAEPEEIQPEEVIEESEDLATEPAAEPEEPETEVTAEPAAEPEVITEPETEPAVEVEPEAVAEPAEEIIVPEEEVVLEKADAKDISSATVTLKYSSLTYTGKPRTQSNSTVVMVGSKTLVKGKDYKITYKNNTNVGTATLTVTGIGNYKGSVNKTFKITPASIAKASIYVKYYSLTYTGNPRTQSSTAEVELTLADVSRYLVYKTDYTITYKNNVNVGTATMTFKGIGNYTGSVKKTFKITPKPLSSAKLKNRAMAYTGAPRMNTVTVYGMYKGKKTVLKEDKDYKLTYENNTKVGLATVKVKGIGNYKGTITKTFTIKPSTITFTRTWVKADGGYKGKITASGGASWTVNVSVTPANNKNWITCGEIGTSNGMYYYYAHGKVYALNIATGKQIWKTEDIGMETVKYAFDDLDGTLYLAASHNMCVASIETDGSLNGWVEISKYNVEGSIDEEDYWEFDGVSSVTAVTGKHRFLVETAEVLYEDMTESGEYAVLTFDGKMMDLLYVDTYYPDDGGHGVHIIID